MHRVQALACPDVMRNREFVLFGLDRVTAVRVADSYPGSNQVFELLPAAIAISDRQTTLQRSGPVSILAI